MSDTRPTAVAYVTTYGNHLGDPRYVLVLDYAAVVLSMRDAVRVMRKTVPYHVPGTMTDRERDLAHEAWRNRDVR